MVDLLEFKHGLTRFTIIPRETVRASLKIFEAFEQQRAWTRDADYKYDNVPIADANKLLQDTNRVWPVAIQHGSSLQRTIQRLVDLAFDKLQDIGFDINIPLDISYLERYVVPFPEFYVENAEVNVEGFLVHGDSWVIIHPKTFRQENDQRKRGKFDYAGYLGQYGIYIDHELDSPASVALFNKIMKLARIKTITQPHNSVLQFPQYQKMSASLRVPRDLAYLVSSRSDNVFEPDESDHETKDDGAPGVEGGIEENEQDPFESAPQTDNDSTRTDRTILTPPGTRASSLAPKKNTGDNSALEMSYAMNIESPSEKATVEMSQVPCHEYLEKLVNATQETWSWMRGKGYKVRLGDVVELVQKIQFKDGVGGGDSA